MRPRAGFVELNDCVDLWIVALHACEEEVEQFFRTEEPLADHRGEFHRRAHRRALFEGCHRFDLYQPWIGRREPREIHMLRPRAMDAAAVLMRRTPGRIRPRI